MKKFVEDDDWSGVQDTEKTRQVYSDQLWTLNSRHSTFNSFKVLDDIVRTFLMWSNSNPLKTNWMFWWFRFVTILVRFFITCQKVSTVFVLASIITNFTSFKFQPPSNNNGLIQTSL